MAKVIVAFRNFANATKTEAKMFYVHVVVVVVVVVVVTTPLNPGGLTYVVISLFIRHLSLS
jgi:hypothetical protein